MDVHLSDFDAFIFDMDGVVTRTADVHATAWKRLFDELLPEISPDAGAFDSDLDYLRYIDGKSRSDGVSSFLSSRRIHLPWGSANDSSDARTVCGLGKKKDQYFLHIIRREGVRPFESTVLLLRRLKEAGIKKGVFSASRNAKEVLTAAGVKDLFDARVDGIDAEELGLPGKPNPATLLELTWRLGAQPTRTAVVEDAIAGVAAGRTGGFGLVVGVTRGRHHGELLNHGAAVEVEDLDEVQLL